MALQTADGEEHEEGKEVAAAAKEDEEVPMKVLGFIPQLVEGDCGCCCKAMSRFKYSVNPTIMVLAIVIIWGFVIWSVVDADNASEVMGDANSFIVYYFGWFYIASLIVFGSASVYFMCSVFGDIKLGPEDEPPKYPLFTWFSMLFSAGLGTGLYFFGIYEPVYHLDTMQSGDSRWYHLTTNQQAMEAINITWFHWGFTASACYCAAALPLAYHHHVLNEPLRESVCLMSLIGEKYANGFIGCLIDLTSVIGTMFGVATSLGFGTLAIIAGLKYVFDIEDNLTNQLICMFVITAFATLSVLTGLDYGIRRLSEVNFSFSFINLFYMFLILDPFFILNLFVQAVGYHFQWLIELTFNTQAFEQAGFYDVSESNEAVVTWMTGWTVFYWAWWIAWAPFVGIFIAQISRGRTIREFIIGNMMVPTLMTCIWFTVYGGVGLYNELGSIQNGVECADAAGNAYDESEWFSEYEGHKIVRLSCYSSNQDMLFAAYNTLPLANLISVLSIIAMLMYFITSSDSASHVIDILTAGGNPSPPKIQRTFWAVSEGVLAAVLLASGGGGSTALTALQTASLVAALPFCVVLLFEVLATYKTLCIHKGYIVVEELVFWTNDLFECVKKFPIIILALLCPPYFQTRTRLKMNKHTNNASDKHFEDNYWKYLWISAYWIFWFFTILFLFLEFAATGFLQLGLSFYLFYMIVCCINRGNIKLYYKIDSSMVLFDICSWAVCCCCAAIQEDLQSDRDLEIDLKTKPIEKSGDVLEMEKVSLLSGDKAPVYGVKQEEETEAEQEHEVEQENEAEQENEVEEKDENDAAKEEENEAEKQKDFQD